MIFIALILTIVAMILAIFQLIIVRKQMDDIKSIRKSLSTRFIGQFPSYLNEINDILKGAKREITIVCDVPAYGAFSDPNSWFEYRQTIEKMIDSGVKVNLTFLSKEKRRKIYLEQFKAAHESWEDWISKSNHAILGKPAFIKLESLDDVQRISWDAFVNYLMDYDEKILKSNFESAKTLNELDVGITLYFWIVDGIRAVFAIPKFSLKNHAFVTSGFLTSDSRLIKSLLSLKESFYERERT